MQGTNNQNLITFTIHAFLQNIIFHNLSIKPSTINTRLFKTVQKPIYIPTDDLTHKCSCPCSRLSPFLPSSFMYQIRATHKSRFMGTGKQRISKPIIIHSLRKYLNNRKSNKEGPTFISKHLHQLLLFIHMQQFKSQNK